MRGDALFAPLYTHDAANMLSRSPWRRRRLLSSVRASSRKKSSHRVFKWPNSAPMFSPSTYFARNYAHATLKRRRRWLQNPFYGTPSHGRSLLVNPPTSGGTSPRTYIQLPQRTQYGTSGPCTASLISPSFHFLWHLHVVLQKFMQKCAPMHRPFLFLFYMNMCTVI